MRRQIASKASQLVQGSSFRAVNHYFEMMMDLGLSQLLSGSLNNVTANELQMVVLGSESSGKSTLLERLCNILVLPRDKDTCTTMPIVIKLRNTDTALAPQVTVKEIETDEVVDGPLRIAATGGDARIL